MSLGSPSIPTAPNVDPSSIAGQQANANIATGLMNQSGSMMPLVTPNYSQGYAQVGTGAGGVPIYGISQGFTEPQAQANYKNYLVNQDLAGQMMNYLISNYGQRNLQESQEPFHLAKQYLYNAVDPFNQSKAQFGTAGDYYGQAGSQAKTYAGQDVGKIGDMASGLTGQRMEAAVAGIRPFQTQQRNALDNQLRNQGLHPGMPGYDTAMRELDNSQSLAISTFQSQFQPQAWQQATQIYQDPLTKAQALGQTGELYRGLGGAYGNLGQQWTGLGNASANLGQAWGGTALQALSQALPWLAASAPTMPPAPQPIPLNIAPTNFLGANQLASNNYANQLSAYNAQQQQQSNMLSGLFGLGRTAAGLFGLSERSFKENISPIGTLDNGIKFYTFNYKGDDNTVIGAMADEVEKIIPEAVIKINGIRYVNYAMVLA